MADGHDGGDHGGEHGADFSGHSADAFDSDVTGAASPGFDLGFLAGNLGDANAYEHFSANAHVHTGVADSSGGGWSIGSAGQALVRMGLVDECSGPACDADNGVRLPGVLIRQDRGIVQLLVWPHGVCDTQQLFRRIAARYGLLSLSRRVLGMVASKKLNKSILDTKVFDGPGKRSQPSGVVAGISGNTEVWTEFWQKPARRNFWSSPDIRTGPPMPSHISVTGYSWFYDRFSDYETRIAISVSNPKTCLGGVWTPFDQQAAAQHMVLAVKIALDVYAELSKVKAAPFSVALRQMHRQGFDFNSLASPPAGQDGCTPGLGQLAALRVRPDEMKFELARES